MKTIIRRPGLPGLLAAQSQVAFNDNAIKLVLIGLVQMLLPAGEAAGWVSAIALLLVAPFVIFAPITGWLADRFPKRDVLTGCLWLQLGVMGVLAAACAMQILPLAVAGFFLLGIQSALMAPARRGMARDLAGESVGEAIGWMEMLCIAAILVGSLAGGQMIDGLAHQLGSPWAAALASTLLLIIGCIGALVVFRGTPRRPAATFRAFSWRLLVGHGDLFCVVRRDRNIWRAAWGDAAFYLVGGFLMLTLAQAGRELFPSGHGAARVTGIMMAVLGGGVALGSIVAARLSRRGIALGLVPAGAIGMAGTLIALVFIPAGSGLFLGGLAVAGFFGGWYLVPLGAFLVDRSRDEERGQVLAASGMLSSLAGVAAVGVHAVVSQGFGIGLSGQFLMAGVFLLGIAVLGTRLLLPQVLRVVALALARLRYRVRVNGGENLPATGGALLVCNHLSYVDTIILSLASPRPIRFLSYAGFFQTPLLGPVLRIFGAIPVSTTQAREAIRTAAEHVRAGELVCIFPEGQLTRTGCLLELKGGFELIARRANAPVIVAHLDGLWGSIFSYAGGRYFFKCPQGWVRRTTVSFAKPLAPAEASVGLVREGLLALGAAALAERSVADDPARELVRALRRNPLRVAMVDPSAVKKPVRAGVVLVLSKLLASRWSGLSDERVGVILPPGLGGTLANLGLLLAGKIPVNLNPLVSETAAIACLRVGGVRTIVTARAVRSKFPKYPWPENLVWIEDELRNRRGVVREYLKTHLLPARLLFPHKTKRGGEEAALLFTSGTSGLPKGVPLTASNLLGNLRQVTETGFLKSDDRLLSALPLFHSFGFTIGLLFPLLCGRTLITAPSPLDADAISRAAREGVPTLLLTTPTFLAGYLKRIPRDAFGTLRLVVTGAERLPSETAAACRARFGCDVVEGYGLTEAAPVVCLNMPHPSLGFAATSVQSGSRAGSVGRLVPGLAARVLDPETGEFLPGHSRGVLALRGVNVISAYLDGSSAEKFRDGWFVTGDVVTVDAEGFVFVEGRTSRFSKIGGEMVSHAAVESAVSVAFPDGAHCVMGCPDAQRGEELVLLTTGNLDERELRRALQETVPNLWIPRRLIRLDALPLLPTGKLDLAECRRVAEAVPA